MRFLIARLRTDSLSRSVLKLFFGPRRCGLFCFAESGGEISLVLDEDSFREFQETCDVQLDSAPEIRRELPPQTWSGAESLLQTGVIVRLTAPLVESKIGMFYVGTIDTEVILVDENDFDAAVAALESFQSQSEEARKLSEQQAMALAAPSETLGTVLFLGVRVCIVSFAVADLPLVAQALIRVIFLSGSHKFFSYAEVDGRVCLWLDVRFVSEFPADIVQAGETWRVMQIVHHDDDFIVNSLAKPLAAAGLPLMYSSTYITDYAAVLDSDVDKAVHCLSQRFTVEVEDVE